MSDGYFEKQQKENKGILKKLVIGIFNGLFFITSLRIDENLVGGGYRLTMFFNRKKD